MTETERKKILMRTTKTTFALAAAAASALLLAGCSAGTPAAPGASGTPGGGAEKNTPITLMLNWYPYGEHAALYYGLEKGIYAEHGIDLTIEPGQGSTKTVQAVGAGQVDIGWADTPALLANIEKGVEVTSAGVFLQTTPSAVQVFTDSGISSPADLAGKTIAVSAGDAPTTTFPMYLDAVGLAEDALTQQNLDAAGKVAAMLSGKVDGLIGFAHDQGPTIADKSGREVSYLRYSDAGLNFFSNGLVASTAMANDKPELLAALVQATSESVTAAIADPEGAVASMAGKDPQMPSAAVLAEQWTQTIPLMETPASAGKAPGWNAESDWTATLDVLSRAGLITGEAGLESYYRASVAPSIK